MMLCRFFWTAVLSNLLLLLTVGTVLGGQFGPPEPRAKGFHIGAGYWYNEDKLKVNDSDFKIKHNQAYVELGQSFSNAEVIARVGTSDAKAEDLSDTWKPFGTLGLKAYFPLGKNFGIGPVIQGTYYFGDLKDNVTLRSSGGSTVVAELKIKDYWDLRGGLALQANITPQAKIYAGPFAYYTESKLEASLPPGYVWVRTMTSVDSATAKSKSNFGGFLGFDLSVTKEFRINFEGQYSEYFSGGGSLSYLF
ncbi:MAG: hypothetical protein PHI99_07455 [Syntrophales bacterium]|nr:hypothetical protein [Syntrophales bacterium]